jgi:hypothetical protein
MATNIEVVKNPNENNLSVLRRFQKRVQGAGVHPRERSKRYADRVKSENVKRARTLSYLKKKAVVEDLLKLGKMREVEKMTKKRRR